jgi:kinesin family member 3B
MSKAQQVVLKDKNESVRVCIRVRPLSKKETEEGHECVVKLHRENEIFVQRPFAQEAPKQFTFDLCYDERASQVSIYQNTAAEIITNVLEGYNGTIFAYGQTGTGKTHTMTGVEGDDTHKGIMPRAFEDIFVNIKGDSNLT